MCFPTTEDLRFYGFFGGNVQRLTIRMQGTHDQTDMGCPGRGKKSGRRTDMCASLTCLYRRLVGRQTLLTDKQTDGRRDILTNRHTSALSDSRTDKNRQTDKLKRARRLVRKQKTQKQKSGSARSDMRQTVHFIFLPCRVSLLMASSSFLTAHTWKPHRRRARVSTCRTWQNTKPLSALLVTADLQCNVHYHSLESFV